VLAQPALHSAANQTERGPGRERLGPALLSVTASTAAPPLEPVDGVAGWFRPVWFRSKQAPDLADGERDEAGVGGRRGVRPGWRGCLGVGAVPEEGRR
jgi:hypothetical protein